MNTYSRFPIVFDKGRGCILTDDTGKEYLDFVAGIAVCCLGHNHPELNKTIADQAQKLIHVSNLYWTQPQIDLAEKLVAASGLDKVFYCNSGAEANEAALKLARIYGKLNKSDAATQIIAMENSFHGRTFGAITATGQTKYQQNLNPLLPDILHVPFNDIGALRNAVTDKTCGILMEPIQGEGGIHPADPDYLKAVREICDDENIVLIFDEVQSGIGRTGEFFAYQNYGVIPDVVCMAKGLGGGLPIGGIIARDVVAKAFTPGTHASTFGGNPLVCAAANYVVETVSNPNFLDKVTKHGKILKEQLLALKKHVDIIKDVRGMGLMVGVDVATNTGDIIAKAMDQGLLLIGAGEGVIRFVPPLNVTEAEITRAVNIFSECL